MINVAYIAKPEITDRTLPRAKIWMRKKNRKKKKWGWGARSIEKKGKKKVLRKRKEKIREGKLIGACHG